MRGDNESSLLRNETSFVGIHPLVHQMQWQHWFEHLLASRLWNSWTFEILSSGFVWWLYNYFLLHIFLLVLGHFSGIHIASSCQGALWFGAFPTKHNTFLIIFSGDSNWLKAKRSTLCLVYETKILFGGLLEELVKVFTGVDVCVAVLGLNLQYT